MAALQRLREALQGLGLRLALPFLVKRRALPALLASLDWSARPGATGGEGTRRLAAQLFRPLRLWPTTCLYRALGSYALLRAAGQEVRFVIGVRKEGETLLAHAWLERDGQAIVGAPGPGEQYSIAYAWPADPAAVRAPPVPDPARRLSQGEEVVMTELPDGSGVLLHLQSGYYFTLNPSGVAVWKLIGAGARDASDLVAGMGSTYPGVEPARIRADIDALLAELARESLVIMRR
jgi:hypothetical protein